MPTVLVTGAARGIGKSIVSYLAAAGWDVIGGVRNAADAEALSALPRVSAVMLDITDDAQIAALPQRLDAVVNNAGIAVTGPLEGLTVAEIRRQLEVNVVGQLAVTLAHRRQRCPAAQTDTDLWRSADQMIVDMEAALAPQHRTLYRGHVAGMRKAVPLSQRLAVNPDKVSKVVLQALTARTPRARYPVGLATVLQMNLVTILPTRVRDTVLRKAFGQP